MKAQNKKAQMTLEMTRVFVVGILILSVVAIVTFVTLAALLDSDAIDSRDTISTNASGITFFRNNTINFSSLGAIPAQVQGLVDVVLSVETITNQTGGEVLTAANYTIVAGNITMTQGGVAFNSSFVNVSATFTQTVLSDNSLLVNNVTSGIGDFFSNMPTVFAILGAVLIILAVVLIIIAVGRIRGKDGLEG